MIYEEDDNWWADKWEDEADEDDMDPPDYPGLDDQHDY